ncbi:hypothetical protein HPS174_0526 [Glaesserella parasuis 174]|nr:hypothetical protein HPS174_0526 [Glaesserella parasuis 174]
MIFSKMRAVIDAKVTKLIYSKNIIAKISICVNDAIRFD